MRHSRGFSWINIWLIVFGAGGLILSISDIVVRQPGFPMRINRLIDMSLHLVLPALILFAGLKPLLTLLRKSSAGEPAELSNIEGAGWLGDIFLRSWKRLWSDKLILKFFGAFALVRVLSGLTDSFFERSMYLKLWRSSNSGNPFDNTQPLSDLLHSVISRTAQSGISILNFLSPSVGISGRLIAGAIFSILAIVLVLIGAKKIRTFSHDPELENEANSLSDARIPVIIMALLLAVVIPKGVFMMYKGVIIHETYYVPIIANYGWSVFRSLFWLPLASACVIGLLKRSSRNEIITRESIARDIIKYFMPLAGLYLLLWGIGIVFEAPSIIAQLAYQANAHPATNGSFSGIRPDAFLPLVNLGSFTALLFCFMPYVVVDKGLGTVQGFKSGLRIWREHASDVISFFAFGGTLIAIPMTVIYAMYEFTTKFSVLRVVESPFIMVIYSIIDAVIFVATWELYRMLIGPDAVLVGKGSNE